MQNHFDEKYVEIVSIFDFLLGSTNFLKGMIQEFFLYRKTYKNYFEIILNLIKKKPEIMCILRNNTSIVLTSAQLINLVAESSSHPEFYFDFKNDLIKFKIFDEHTSQIRDIVIYGGISNGDINGIFVNKDYQNVPIKNRTVLDIGANIADSAIYFSLLGANKVIGIEPFTRNFHLAEKNILENNLQDKIILQQAICSDYTGTTEIDPTIFSTASSVFEQKKRYDHTFSFFTTIDFYL